MEFKPAKCPNCGGQLQLPENAEKVKCMYCGGDLVVKEAIKLAIGTVNLDNLRKLAETAEKTKNYKEAYEYYTKILEHEQNDYQAWYGKAISAGWQGNLIETRIDEVVHQVQIAIEKAPVDKRAELKIRASLDLNALGAAFYSLAVQNFDMIITMGTFALFVQRMEALITLFTLASEYNPKDKTILENIITVSTAYLREYQDQETLNILSLTGDTKHKAKTRLHDAEYKLDKIDPNYKAIIPEQQKETQSGCFIATACYGSEYHPSVEILREFRDEVLMKISLGRFLVKVYYAVSPWIASKIKQDRFLSNIIKDFLLQPVVSRVATHLEKLK